LIRSRSGWAALVAPQASAARWQWVALLLFAVLVIGVGYGLRDPWPSDEPRFALVAKYMLDTSNWIVPHLGSEIYPDKPPVLFWLQATVMAITGSVRWSFLLPSLLAGVLTIWLSYDLIRRLWCRRTALLVSLLLLMSFQFTYQVRGAQIDGLLIGIMSASMYSFLRYLLLADQRRWLLLGGLLAGFGVITKGVGGLTLLVLPIAWLLQRFAGVELAGLKPHLAHTAEPRSSLWWALPAALVGIAIWALPLSYVSFVQGDREAIAYVEHITVKQTVGRYANPWHHHQPWWYFLKIIALSWLPMSLCLWWSMGALRRRWQRRDARVLLPLAWVLATLLFFSLSSGKRDVYILPLLPVFAWATASFWPGLLKRTRLPQVAGSVGLLLAGALLVAGILGHWHVLPAADRFVLSHGFNPWPAAMVMGGIGLLLAAVASYWRGFGIATWIGALLGIWMSYGLVGYPSWTDARSGRAVMARVNLHVTADQPLALVAWTEQMYLQAGRPVADFGFKQPHDLQERAAHQWLSANPNGALLMQKKNLPRCFVPEVAQSMGDANRRSWWLVTANGLKAACDS
jgi:4-amino-4-deoxy-L-arabinose transferase-like glycosyltransferase